MYTYKIYEKFNQKVLEKRHISTPEVSYSNRSTRSFNLVLIANMISLTTYSPPNLKVQNQNPHEPTFSLLKLVYWVFSLSQTNKKTN